MKNEIVTNIDTPEKLERLYRRDKFQFEDWLVEAIKMFPNSETLRVWHARVNYTPSPSGKRENKGLISIFILSLLSFTLLKLPYTKNTFIMLLLQSLGYDVFNPVEVIPQYITICEYSIKR